MLIGYLFAKACKKSQVANIVTKPQRNKQRRERALKN
jgi:hypothetical protein